MRILSIIAFISILSVVRSEDSPKRFEVRPSLENWLIGCDVVLIARIGKNDEANKPTGNFVEKLIIGELNKESEGQMKSVEPGGALGISDRFLFGYGHEKGKNIIITIIPIRDDGRIEIFDVGSKKDILISMDEVIQSAQILHQDRMSRRQELEAKERSQSKDQHSESRKTSITK